MRGTAPTSGRSVRALRPRSRAACGTWPRPSTCRSSRPAAAGMYHCRRRSSTRTGSLRPRFRRRNVQVDGRQHLGARRLCKAALHRSSSTFCSESWRARRRDDVVVRPWSSAPAASPKASVPDGPRFRFATEFGCFLHLTRSLISHVAILWQPQRLSPRHRQTRVGWRSAGAVALRRTKPSSTFAFGCSLVAAADRCRTASAEVVGAIRQSTLPGSPDSRSRIAPVRPMLGAVTVDMLRMVVAPLSCAA